MRGFYNVQKPLSSGHPSLFHYSRKIYGEADRQSPGSPAISDDIQMYRIMMDLMPQIERITGKKLFPTYNYFRNYGPYATLNRHLDRPACEISCTMNIGYEGAYNWPIWVKDKDGTEHEVVLEPGDALVYQGCELEHWREPSEGRVILQSQVFMHFVDQYGPHAEEVFDKNKRSVCKTCSHNQFD